MLRKKIAEYAKKKATEQSSVLIENATNEVKSQYKFVLFMAKLYLVLGVAILVGVTGAVGYGIYSLITG